MTSTLTFGDVSVTVDDHHVARVEIHRPPDNYFDVGLIASLADAYEVIDDDPAARAIVLCAEGKHFCAGADFRPRTQPEPPPAGGQEGPGGLYHQALRLFGASTPVVAAVQGAAIGGGLGLACSADFRVAGSRARFSANFARLGFHHGFGLTVTLPAIVAQQACWDLLYTGRRVPADEAHRMGLCDRLATGDDPRPDAYELAAGLASSAPLAVVAIRATMRAGLADRIRAATAHEQEEQARLAQTADWREGIQAAAERREPRFEGR